ncbi:hypothetical protein JYK21_07295 [Ralstonia pickettii]|nr:hypothetical protein [Ralstonia pickettii]
MEIKVNEQAQQFYLAMPKRKEWVPIVGHEIKVGKYRFSASPVNDVINVSEVTTGAKVMNIPLDPITLFMTAEKESAIDYFYSVGERIKKIIEKQTDFDSMLAEMKKKTFEQLGEMPEIIDVEMEVQ